MHLDTAAGTTLAFSATQPIVTPVDLPWPGFRDHLVVVGLSFLEGCVMTVYFQDLTAGALALDQI